jgi:hypothetical protein
MVALFGTGYEHDVVTDANGELAAGIHQGCYGEVGQREQGAALTDVSPVEVTFRDYHFCYSVFRVYFCYLAAGVGCKAVCTIQ